jgi:endoglucanase
MPAQSTIPRWRGFNVTDLFGTNDEATFDPARDGNFREDDFRWLVDWGFDFVRVPMDYRLWLVDRDPFTLNEAAIAKVDRVVRLGEQYGVHISLNFHTAPGYCINTKPLLLPNLWQNPRALDAFCFQWGAFAERYRGIPSERLSFDLVNEPPSIDPDRMTLEDFTHVSRAATEAIRAVDPDRLVMVDGYNIGRSPCPELVDLGVAQSCRGYDPMTVSHYRAPWIPGSMDYPIPAWPESADTHDTPWNREALAAFYVPWADLAQQGVGVHCGECGVYKYTPHAVALAWLDDVLDILTGHGIGYALWNFRGDFGILDSGRADVPYEDWHGHQLDRALLALLQRH